MAPIIHCIRHGQGLHNLYGDYTLPDPVLTPLGEEKCATLRSGRFAPDTQRRISLIAASPLKRALQTANLVFEPLFGNSSTDSQNENADVDQMQILALPDAQETSSDPCDVGTELSALSSFLAAQNPPWNPIDLSLLTSDPPWNLKSFRGRFSPHSDAIKARARATRLFLRETIVGLMAKEANDDIEVVLVSHGGFLHYFSGDWENAASRPGTGWTNCEMRSYQFASPASTHAQSLCDDPDARLVETMASRQARGLNCPMFGPSQQEKLFIEAMEGWEAQGLERPDRLEDPALASAPVPALSPPRQLQTAKTETEKAGGPELEQDIENSFGFNEKSRLSKEKAKEIQARA